ncbi:MAG: helix-turn-helix transcriptional regulator [Pseudonocardiaceae bacterium]
MNTMTATRLSLITDNRPALGHAGIDALLASAVREVGVMCTSVGAGQIGRFRRVDYENLRRRVRYRVLFPDSARLSGMLSNLAMAGAEVRTDVKVPIEALVIDGQIAVLPADRSATGSRAGAVVFQLPSVVTATVGLFERIWPAAVPLTPTDLPDARDTMLAARERDLLTLLCAGATDESAAARLGISVRTVRRTVADIMNRLGARSRFQAGAKAAGRGWLMETAC